MSPANSYRDNESTLDADEVDRLVAFRLTLEPKRPGPRSCETFRSGGFAAAQSLHDQSLVIGDPRMQRLSSPKAELDHHDVKRNHVTDVIRHHHVRQRVVTRHAIFRLSRFQPGAVKVRTKPANASG